MLIDRNWLYVKAHQNVYLDYVCVQMQRSRSGDRQPPPRGGGPDLGKEIMKAEHYPTLGKCMELLREGLRIMILNPLGVIQGPFP